MPLGNRMGALYICCICSSTQNHSSNYIRVIVSASCQCSNGIVDLNQTNRFESQSEKWFTKSNIKEADQIDMQNEKYPLPALKNCKRYPHSKKVPRIAFKRRNEELPKQLHAYQGQLFPGLLSTLQQHLVQPMMEPAKEKQK